MNDAAPGNDCQDDERDEQAPDMAYSYPITWQASRNPLESLTGCVRTGLGPAVNAPGETS